MSREENLTPGGQPHEKKRRHYKAQRLPPDVQDLIARGFIRGDSFRAIAAAARAAGHPIGKDAIRNFWHAVWKDEHERLRNAHLVMIALKDALRLDPDSPSGKFAQEMLYTMVVSKLGEIEKQPSMDLLQEAREQAKVGEKKNGKPTRRAEMNPAEQAREVRRRWRELYGLEADAEENADEVGEDGQADSSPPEPGKGSE